MKKKPYPSETQERFIVRLPDGMRDRIAAEAKANNRSMNAEIVARLEGSLDGTSVSLPERLRDELVSLSEASGLPFETVFIRTLVDALDHHPDDALADPVIVDQARQIWRMRQEMVVVHLALVSAGWQLEQFGAPAERLENLESAKRAIWAYVKDWAEMTFEEVNAERSRLGFVPLQPDEYLPLAGRAREVQQSSRVAAGGQKEPAQRSHEDLRRDRDDPEGARRHAERERRAAADEPADASSTSSIDPSTREGVAELHHYFFADDDQPLPSANPPPAPTAEKLRRELKEDEEKRRAYEREEEASGAAAQPLSRPPRAKKRAK